MNTILQVPLSKELREQASTKAHDMGFSSLQEAVRLFLHRIAKDEINFTFEKSVKLSPKAIKRYNKMIDEIESGEVKTKSFTNVDDMMKYLHED